MSQVLLEEVGPNGNIQAVVESADDVCFLYLHGSPESKFGMRTLWVCNHTAAPQQIERDRMREGKAPRNPAAYCRNPQGRAIPDPDRLRVIWLPEGNGIALLEDDDILAIIPSWGGSKGFDGYAREAVGEGPLAWELGSDNVLISRFSDAQDYWDLWDGNLWERTQASQLSTIETALGPHSNYYAIDGDEWPPKALIRVPRLNGVALVTLGMSLRPQPNVEMSTDEPEQFRRVELGAILPKSWSDDAINNFASYLSAQSRLPWDRYTWLGSGHTIPCDSWQNPDYPVALLQYHHPAAPALNFEDLIGDPVKMLWFIPITEAERQVAVEHGSKRLLEQLPSDRWSTA